MNYNKRAYRLVQLTRNNGDKVYQVQYTIPFLFFWRRWTTDPDLHPHSDGYFYYKDQAKEAMISLKRTNDILEGVKIKKGSEVVLLEIPSYTRIKEINPRGVKKIDHPPIDEKEEDTPGYNYTNLS